MKDINNYVVSKLNRCCHKCSIRDSTLGGVISAIPLEAIVVISASVYKITTAVIKMASTKIKKCSKKSEKVRAEPRQADLFYSRAINDNELTSSEYEEIMKFSELSRLAEVF